MPVFISYSHQDKAFAKALAKNLVARKTHVWLDDWEVSAGESLIEKVQSALQGASALIVVLSKASVASVWCKKEIVAGIQRELEEKQTLVIPALLETCDIPLFLRDKKYADFRTDPDKGLEDVIEAIAKVANPTLGRIEEDDYFTDWSYDWFDIDRAFGMRFTILQHSKQLPYSVLTTLTILCNEEATKRYTNYKEAGLESFGHLVIVESVLEGLADEEFFVLIEDNFAKTKKISVVDPKIHVEYHLFMETRRLGGDTGKDILMHGADEIRKIRNMVVDRVRPPTAEQKAKLVEVVRKNMKQ